MKIRRDLPQFNNEKALIIVASEKDGQFYFANDGRIDEIFEYRTPRLLYAESKKRFKPMIKIRAGAKGVMRTGSLHEVAKGKNEELFLKEFRRDIKRIIADYKIGSFYVFSSALTIGDVFRNLPKSLKREMRMAKRGNFHKKHPFDLLKIIAKHEPDAVALTSQEAGKILQINK